MAHESGHLWRDEKGLDIKKSDSPYSPNSPKDGIFQAKRKFSSEYEAMHIENVIMPELGKPIRKSRSITDYKSSAIGTLLCIMLLGILDYDIKGVFDYFPLIVMIKLV